MADTSKRKPKMEHLPDKMPPSEHKPMKMMDPAKLKKLEQRASDTKDSGLMKKVKAARKMME